MNLIFIFIIIFQLADPKFTVFIIFFVILTSARVVYNFSSFIFFFPDPFLFFCISLSICNREQKIVKNANEHIQLTAQRLVDEDALTAACFFSLEDDIIEKERRASRMHLFRYDTGVKKLIHMKNVLEEECSARLAEDSILLDTLIESQQLLQHTVRTSSRCCIWLGCIVLCWVVLYCVVLYCIVLCCVVLHWVVWCGVVWCVVLCGVMRCSVTSLMKWTFNNYVSCVWHDDVLYV